MLGRFLLLTILFAGTAQAQWFMEADPVVVTREEWGSQPKPMNASPRQSPTRIVLHHSGVAWKDGTVPLEKVRNLQRWGQNEKGWPDLPYHFLITPDGQIFEGRDWHYPPESNTEYDLNGVLNLCLFGNFEVEKVTTPQRQSLLTLLAYLQQRHDIPPEAVRSHREEAPGQTACPGRDLQNWLESELRSD